MNARQGRPRCTFLAAAGLVLAAVQALAGAAGEAVPVAAESSSAEAPLRWREILSEGNSTRIRLEVSPQPSFAVEASDNRSELRVEMQGVRLDGVPPKVQVGDGVVESVQSETLPGGAARLTINLTGPGRAEVLPWPNGLDVVVRLGTAEAAAAPSPNGPVVRRLEVGEGLLFALGASPTKLAAFPLSDGRRLVIDADGVTLPDPQLTEEFAEGAVTRVRMMRQDGRVRVVVETRTAADQESYLLDKRPDGFALILNGPPARPAAAPAAAAPEVAPSAPTPPAAQAPAGTTAAEAQPTGGGEVLDLGFRQEGDRSIVEVVLSKPAPYATREASARRVVVDVFRTDLPEKFRRALDTTAFSGPVGLVAAYPRANGKTTDTRLVIDLKRGAAPRVDASGSRLTISFQDGAKGPAPESQGVADVRRSGGSVVVIEGSPKPSAATGAAVPEPREGKGGSAQAGYTGRKLSMDFVDADIRNVLRLIGEVSGYNVVAGDDVQGKVTVRLVEVPWDQALEVILKTRGLDQVREGNVIRIAPADKLAQEKAKAMEGERSAEEKAPLVSDIIAVNYATASEVLDKVKAVLTARGSVAVDQRTNTILVKDLADKVAEARTLVGRLDTPTPQVLIEARIVEVTSNSGQQLGVQWGGRFSADTSRGSATDWAFPHSIGLGGSASPDNNYAVNLPATVDTAGALSLSLGHVNDVLSLDLRLSALESANRGRVISTPRVTTLDNRTAEISQGSEIPFTTSTQEKIETKSIDYKLVLNVTPHVTADRSIIMKIDLKKDDISSRTAADGKTPAKDTKSASTEVLVKDGETTVIGGIVSESQTNSTTGIPFLSKIPGLGWLFKSKNDSEDKRELIIFITPKIVTPNVLARSK